jgi:hypothetical protein
MDADTLLRCGASMHENVLHLSPKGGDYALFLDDNPGLVGNLEGGNRMGWVKLRSVA